MKNFTEHPFFKFLMVLVAIIAVALTVLVVFKVIEEIRVDDDYYYRDNYQSGKMQIR